MCSYIFINLGIFVPESGTYIKKYCRRIALAILLFGVPYAASELVVAERTFRIRMIPEALKMTLMGHTWSHMWYLYLILFLYLITPLLKKVLRVLPVWGVVAMMAVIFLGSSVAPFLNKVLDVNSIPVLPDGGVYFLYYLCGYFFAVREVCVDKGRNVWLTAAVAVLALGMILSRTLAGFSIQMAYNYPFTVLLAVLLFAAGWNGSIKKYRIPWQEAGALSFAVSRNISSGVPSIFFTPRSITMILSACAASSMKWVIHTTVMPFSRLRRRMVDSTSRRPDGSSMAVDSSAIMTDGCMARMPAMAMRCFCPPESICGAASAN